YVWPLPEALCPIWIYLDVLFSTASIMHLCAISLDRYVAICNPIQHSRFNSRTKAMLKIAAVWTISIGISTPIPVIGLRNTDKVFVNGSCMLNEERFVLVGSFVAFFIPLVIMVVTYCLTVQALQRQASVFLYEAKASSQQPLQPSAPSSSQLAPPPVSSRRSSLNCLRMGNSLTPSTPDSISMVAGSEAPSQLSSPAVSHGRRGMMQAIKNERRASKVLGVVFFLFLLMWCPFFITNVLSVLCRGACNDPLLSDLLNVFVWVGYISSGVNPLVYTLFNKTYRHAFSSYMRCRYSGVRLKPVAIHVPCPSQAAVTPLLICVDVDRNSNCRNGDGNTLQKLELPDIDTHLGIEMQTGVSALSVNSCHNLAEHTSSV
ncbi:5-hydroxytryptamine (serotonin) receptor 2C, G protein-coupled-like 1, partial [Tachysurus ichikawai]